MLGNSMARIVLASAPAGKNKKLCLLPTADQSNRGVRWGFLSRIDTIVRVQSYAITACRASIACTLENANCHVGASLPIVATQQCMGVLILRADGAQNDQVQKESRVRCDSGVCLA